MSKKIRFYYALNNVSDRSFIMAIERDLTCKDVLQKISEKQKLDYISIFYEGSEINTDDEIIDYWETDPDYIFYVSTVSEPPTREFMDNINMKRTTSKSAKLKAPEISDHDKDKSTSDAKPAKTECIKSYTTKNDTWCCCWQAYSYSQGLRFSVFKSRQISCSN